MKAMSNDKQRLNTKTGIMLAILLLTGLTGCNSVRLESSSDPAFADRAIGKTMILGVSDRLCECRKYEEYFVDVLKNIGVDAVSCHALLQSTNDVDEAVLVDALVTNGFKSIIVTRLVAEQDRSQFVHMPGAPDYYDDFYGFYSAGTSHELGYVQHVQEFSLESNLYDVQSRRLIWSGHKSVYDTHSEMSNIKGVVKAIVKDLKEKGLLTEAL